MIQKPFFNLNFFFMANIKLGAIITDIAGSIGGSTFRRTPRGIICYNKQGRQIKSAFAKRSVKNKLGAVLASWSYLDPGVKNDWADLAPLYPQKDKFGGDVVLTARQFYTKLNTQLVPVEASVDLNDFNDVVYLGSVVSVTLEMSANDFIITCTNTVRDFYCLVSVFPLRRNSAPKPTKKAFPTYSAEAGDKVDFNIFGAFIQQYPNAEPGLTWGVNIIFMNSSGFQTSVQAFSIVAD
jgi:hypothetical protein